MAKILLKEENSLPYYEVWLDTETGAYETIHRGIVISKQ